MDRYVRALLRIVLIATIAVRISSSDHDSLRQVLERAEHDPSIELALIYDILGPPIAYASRRGREVTVHDSGDLPASYMMVYGWLDDLGQWRTDQFDFRRGQEAFHVQIADGVPAGIDWSFVPLEASYRGLYFGMSLDEFVDRVDPLTTIDLDIQEQPESTFIARRGDYPKIGLEVYSPRDRILFLRSSGASDYLDLANRLSVVLAPIRGGPVGVFRIYALLNPDLVDPLRGRL